MANFVYTHAKHLIATGALNLDTADLRALLVMSNTTTDTEEDKTTISGFTTLDEYNGSAYARKTLGASTVTEDTGNNRSEVDVADFAWSALGAGTRSAQAMVVFAFVTNDADSVPIAFIDTGGFPFAGNGGDVNVTVNAEGLLQVT